jgi:hypothetical protein
MTIQNYLIIQKNTVTNSVLWDGDTDQWQPPTETIMLIQADALAMVWEFDKKTQDYVLTEIIGAGDIGFTWDGTKLTTNQPKPKKPMQPKTTGTQTLGA